MEEKINIKYFTGDTTIVENVSAWQWRVLPFSVLSFIQPEPDAEWHGTSCEFQDTGLLHFDIPGCWVIPAYTPHCFQVLDRKHCSIWAHLHCTLESGVDLLQFYKLPRFLPEAFALKDTLLTCNAFAHAADPAGYCRFRAACYSILEQVLQQGTAEKQLPCGPFVRKALACVEEHFRQRIQLDDLAQFCGCSKSAFEKRFRKEVGVSPGEFILRRRIREAALLLRSSDLTPVEIAEHVGFPDVYSFGKAFRKQLLIPPVRYRKLKRGFFD